MSRAPLLPVLLAASALAAPAARAQEPDDAEDYETIVVTTTPVHGSWLPLDRIPSNVQTGGAAGLQQDRSFDLSEHLARGFGSVHVNSVQGNPLQPDVQYRGFVASPVLGASQGLSVYLGGVRLNEPFGDTVNWDLIPTNAIESINLMPGSNPLYGLNTLGGALSLETKTGFSSPGAAAHLAGGSFLRRSAMFEQGQHGDRFAVFVAGSAMKDAGWREFSPSTALSAFATGSYRGAATRLDLSVAGADTELTGNGAAPVQLLEQQRDAVFTHPDLTTNRMVLVTARGERDLSATARLSATLYYRRSDIDTLNGDAATWPACRSPGLTGFLCGAGDDAGGAETPIVDARGRNVPVDATFPYDAVVNRTSTGQDGFGAAVQATVETPVRGRENHLFAGAAVDLALADFASSAELARLSSTRGTLGTDIHDPTSRVGVGASTRTLSLFGSEVAALRRDLFLTLSGRINAAHLSLEDHEGDDLDGDHSFFRANPAIGLSYQPRAAFGVFAGYSESARTPTPLELTCASPDAPCRLPNGFAADPPLALVVAHTAEAGARGRVSLGRTTLHYDAAIFHTRNTDDILFISAGPLVNTGYFSNVGSTVRQGVEANLSGTVPLARVRARLRWSAHYTLLDATFRTPFTARSENHPQAVNGSIAVPLGARIPSVPRHIAKASLELSLRDRVRIGADLLVQGDQVLRGDEANLLAPIPGFALVNLVAQADVTTFATVFLRVSNLFDAHYATFGALGNATQTLGPTFDDPRFHGPGAPRAAYAGVDLRY